MNRLLFVSLILSCCIPVNAQTLQPGFQKTELLDMLNISSRFGDSSYFKEMPLSPAYKFIYRSPVMGLENKWDLWVRNNDLAIISIRGTTQNNTSWLANFYAAMVPAKGSLQLSETDIFDYELADDPKAAVHVGWLVGTAFLSKDMLPKIDSCYKAGIKQVMITGHSQGGAIAYLLTAYLYHLQRKNILPADIRLKTYGTAAPKPGNLFFAYDYENITQGGWAYNVVNAADWVPEAPFTVQTLNDFNATNPFVNAKSIIRKQGFPKNLVLKYVYNRMSKPSFKAQKNYQRFLGDFTSKNVKKILPGFSTPQYFKSNNYVRTGAVIVLQPDAAYLEKYPQQDSNAFLHHLHPPYLMLAKKLALP